MKAPALLLCAPLLAGFVLTSVCSAFPARPAAILQEGFAGTWQGEFSAPFDPQPLTVRIGLEQVQDGSWRGGFDADMLGPALLRGPAAAEGLALECDFGGSVSELSLSRGKSGDDSDSENKLHARLTYQGLPIALELTRTAADWIDALHFEVELPDEVPTQVVLAGLDEGWLLPIQREVAEAMTEQGLVGLALAVAVDRELFDARSWGWSDVSGELPVGGETLFRWGSVSKVVTGIVAGKLALEGKLDLDADVRELVPEFPKKPFVVTTRQLLGHLGGIVHYQHMPVVTRVDYGVEFPFRDAVRAIDMFRSAPLIHAPGSTFSYSTHGFVLAGAALERSSELGFQGEVRRLVSEPLQLTTLEMDDPGAPRKQRTKGYRRTADGRVFESGDSNVAWKLAAGGFQSTVSDMARFGGALSDEHFVDEALQNLLFVSQQTAAGRSTGYSLGLSVSEGAGRLFVSHGGAQRRTRTHLLVAPREGLAVALMCNTESANLQELATDIMRVLLDEQ